VARLPPERPTPLGCAGFHRDEDDIVAARVDRGRMVHNWYRQPLLAGRVLDPQPPGLQRIVVGTTSDQHHLVTMLE
jgi:hypothetical protein